MNFTHLKYQTFNMELFRHKTFSLRLNIFCFLQLKILIPTDLWFCLYRTVHSPVRPPRLHSRLRSFYLLEWFPFVYVLFSFYSSHFESHSDGNPCPYYQTDPIIPRVGPLLYRSIIILSDYRRFVRR